MAEGYLAPGKPTSELLQRVQSAAASLSADGDPIRLVLTVILPEDESTLWFFAPANEATAGRLVERAGLSVDRIVSCRIGRPTEPPEAGS